MAKQIKAIKCPHCGSISKTEIKPDHFKCNHCNTEYFLDNDDININHNLNYNTPTQQYNPAITKKIALFFGIAIFAFFLIMLIIPAIFKNSGTNKNTYRPVESAAFYWHYKDNMAFTNSKGQVIVVVFGNRNYMGNDSKAKEGTYISFYDLKTEEEIKSQKVENITEATFNSYSLSEFPNAELYGIANKTTVFKIDKENLSISDITQRQFAGHQKLASGIANIEFAYDSYGYAFNLMTNEGANFFYFPLEDKIYTKEEVYAAQRSLEQKIPNEKLVTKYDFTSLSSDYPAEKVQLIKFTMRDANGGPDEDTHLSWRKDYRGQKSLTSFGNGFVRSFSDLTPGRLYFKPQILYYDNDYVLISANKTAAEAAPTNIQCIDAKTGKLLFTYACSKNEYFYKTIRYKDGFIFTSHLFLLALGKDGKLIKEFKIK